MLGLIVVNALLGGIQAPADGVRWHTPPPIRRDKGARPVTTSRRGNPGGTLPFAHGKKFATLDAYLAHRQKLGAIDAPWYRQIRPGIYELVARGAPSPEVKTFTRAELAEKFGFEE